MRQHDHYGIDGGPETTRIPVAVTQAEEFRRELRRRKAVRYLTDSDNTDLLPMLGLAPAPPPVKACQVCGQPKGSTGEERKSHAARHAAETNNSRRQHANGRRIP